MLRTPRLEPDEISGRPAIRCQIEHCGQEWTLEWRFPEEPTAAQIAECQFVASCWPIQTYVFGIAPVMARKVQRLRFIEADA